MLGVVLRKSASPVYAFLSLIHAKQSKGETQPGKRILDCGAGGSLPPLALFDQQGFDCWGIDISDEQLKKARDFCDHHKIHIDFRMGDMRQIPFEDESFDFVYEHFSMCHLSKQDTANAIREMRRVLKKGGLCLLGVMLTENWPKSFYGEEKIPGEYWGEEQGDLIRHTMFTDNETEQLVSGWEILTKEKQVLYLRGAAERTSLDEWMDLYNEVSDRYTRDAWQAGYVNRTNDFQYVHIYYYLRKPGD